MPLAIGHLKNRPMINMGRHWWQDHFSSYGQLYFQAKLALAKRLKHDNHHLINIYLDSFKTAKKGLARRRQPIKKAIPNGTAFLKTSEGIRWLP